MITEDGVTIGIGDLAYNYYGNRLDDSGIVRLMSVDDDGWGRWLTLFPHHDSDMNPLLDGSRVCSLQAAWRKGWRIMPMFEQQRKGE